MDRVLVINTGDSIVALSTDIEDNHGRFGYSLYSPRVATCSTSNLSTASSPAPDHLSCSSKEQFEDIYPFEDVENTENCTFGLPLTSSCFLHGANYSSYSCSETLHEQRATCKERRTSFGKENLLNSPLGSIGSINSPLGSSSEASPKHDPVPRKTFDVYAFEGGEAGPSGSLRSSRRVYNSMHLPLRRPAPVSSILDASASIPSLDPNSDINLYDTNDQDGSNSTEKPNVFHKPTGVLRVQTRDTSSLGLALNRSMPGLSLLSPDSLSGRSLCMSPGYGSSTCSSCMSSPIILQSESQCFTYSVRKYMEAYGRPDSPTSGDGKIF